MTTTANQESIISTQTVAAFVGKVVHYATTSDGNPDYVVIGSHPDGLPSLLALQVQATDPLLLFATSPVYIPITDNLDNPLQLSDYQPAEHDLTRALLPTITELDSAYREARQRATRHENKIDQIVTRMHREADERNWCEEFDDICDDLDLPRRTSEFTVLLDVTARASVRISTDAVSAEAARQEVEDALGNADDAVISRVTAELRQALEFDPNLDLEWDVTDAYK